MKQLILFLSIIQVTVCINLSAKTHTGGTLGNKVFDPSGNPYIIDSTIIVPEKTIWVIKAGTIIQFDPNKYSSIDIYGQFYVEGTADNPVVFTSINDTAFNKLAKQPPYYDWNGITIHENSGTISLQHFLFRHSLYGIRCENLSKNVAIKNGIFNDNGSNIEIGDSIPIMLDGDLFSYKPEAIKTPPNLDSIGIEKPPVESDEHKIATEIELFPEDWPPQEPITPVPTKFDTNIVRDDTKQRQKKIFSFSSIGLGAVTGIVTTVTGIIAINKYNDLCDADKYSGGPGWRDDTIKKYKGNLAATIINGIICGAVVPVSILYFRKNKKLDTAGNNQVNINANGDEIGIGFGWNF